MSTNNKVFQVLVAKVDSALLAAGNTVDDLAVGQIGIFDAETNLSLDATATTKKNFYIAVGVDSNGDSAVDKFMFSAGQHIQKDYIRNVELKNYVAPVNQVIDISNFSDVKNAAEYTVKLEFRNQQIYQRQGTNQYTKSFSVVTTGDTSVNPVFDMITKMLAEFNADESGIFTAEAVVGKTTIAVTTSPTASANLTVTVGTEAVTVAVLSTDNATQTATKISAALVTAGFAATSSTSTVTLTKVPVGTVTVFAAGTTGAVATVTNGLTAAILPAAFSTLESGVYPNIRVTSSALAISKYFGINPKYYYLRQTVIVPSLLDFPLEAKALTVVDAVAEQGGAYEIKQKEYQAGGWNAQPGPYRTSSTLGYPYEGIEFNAVDGVKYIQIHLVYDFFSTAGWGEYLSNLMTIIAIPNTYTTLAASIVTVLNGIVGTSLSDPI